MAERHNEKAILAFLRELWPEGIPPGMVLALFHLGTSSHRLLRDLVEASRLLNAGAFTCFGCALVRGDTEGRGTASDATAIPGLWLDLDLAGGDHAKSDLPSLEEALEFVDSLPLPPTLVLHSGGGLYLWWAFREPWTFNSSAERARAQQLVSDWQSFILEQAATRGWDLDDTSPLSQLLRAEGSVNTKYAPPRTVHRIRTGGPRWNPCDFEGWTASEPAIRRAEVALPKELEPWLARAIEGLGVPTRERRDGGLLRAVVLELCPACGGIQETRRGLARWTAHVAPRSGALRCKRQSCEARELADGGGLEPALWSSRFLAPDVANDVHRLRAGERATNDPAAPDENTVTLAEADAGKLAELIDDAIDHAQAGPRIALVVATLGAGKTRIVVERLARHRGAYFARNHKLLREVADELEKRGVPYMHVQGVGEACFFREAFEHYGRRSDWRRLACGSCPHLEDRSCRAWDTPQGTVILAPHAALQVLNAQSVLDPDTGRAKRVLADRLKVLDEGADFVETLVVDRERLRAPLNNPGSYGTLADLAEKISLLIDALLTRCIRRRLEDSARSAFPSRYGGQELSTLWSEATAEWDPKRVQWLLESAANVRAQSWPRPCGRSLREQKLDRAKLTHPELRRVWRLLLGTVSSDAEVRTEVQKALGRLEVVVMDMHATIEIRAPWRIPLSRKSGVVVLDATGRLTLAELQAAHPRTKIREFTLKVLPNPNARLLRAHVETKSVSRRRLLKSEEVTPRAFGTLRNALREVSKLAQEHLGKGRHRCGLLTYKPIANVLVQNANVRRLVAPPGLNLPADLVGYFGCDERGSNRFAGVSVLVTFGDPVPNIGATEADGRVLDVPAQELIDDRTAARLVQAHGRSRSLRAIGPVLHVHVGRVRPPEWEGCKVLGLPPGRPISEARERICQIVEVLLSCGDVVAAPFVNALFTGALVPPDPLLKTAYRSLIGSFERTPPVPAASFHRWLTEEVGRLGAVAASVTVPDSAWAVWRPEFMPVDEAAVRARRWWEAMHLEQASSGTAPMDLGAELAGLAKGRILDLEPWHERYEERAAVLESEACLSRTEAERRARAEIVAEFLESMGGDRAA